MRRQCPVCAGRGRVRAITRRGTIGVHECSSCGGIGHTTVSDNRVHPHLIPGTNPNPMPDHLIDVDRAVGQLPDTEHTVVCEHYQRNPWWTQAQHANRLAMSLRSYERYLHEARNRVAERLWPKKRA